VAGEAPAVVGLKAGRNGAAALKTGIVVHRRSTFRAQIVFSSVLSVKRAHSRNDEVKAMHVITVATIPMLLNGGNNVRRGEVPDLLGLSIWLRVH
jgi:hypothetical protein